MYTSSKPRARVEKGQRPVIFVALVNQVLSWRCSAPQYIYGALHLHPINSFKIYKYFAALRLEQDRNWRLQRLVYIL